MKIAIVTDDLIQHGGQERITEALVEMFPDATLYSSIISKDWKSWLNNHGVSYKTSFADKLPLAAKLSRYYTPFLIHNIAYESFNFSEYDLVLSNTSRFGHWIITKPTTKQLCYMHSPGRMFWTSGDYFKNETFGWLRPIKSIAPFFLSYFLSYQRMLDYVAAQRVDAFAANSTVSQARIKKYYGRDSRIIAPFIDMSLYTGLKPKHTDFYLAISRLVPWKRLDIAIESCIALNLKLKIIGEGPDRQRLEKLAGNSGLVEFLGGAPENVKLTLLQDCIALIQTQYEDFGIVPLEANAAGKVVIGYGAGGILDTMISDKTSVLFTEQTVEALKSQLIKFDYKKYDIKECIKNAARFDKAVFKQNMLEFVTKPF